MLGFKKFYNATRVLIGVELLQKLNKGQYRVPSSFGRTLDTNLEQCPCSMNVNATEPRNTAFQNVSLAKRHQKEKVYGNACRAIERCSPHCSENNRFRNTPCRGHCPLNGLA
jgi:hypothetical protein